MRRRGYFSENDVRTINQLFNVKQKKEKQDAQAQETSDVISFSYCEDAFDKQISLAGEVNETKDLALVSKL